MLNQKEFHLDEYLNLNIKIKETKKILSTKSKNTFVFICKEIKELFSSDYDENEDYETTLKRQKKAIIGYAHEVNYYKSKIEEYLKLNNWDKEGYPPHYKSLVDAIFAENWGFAGLTPWLEDENEDYKNSSSAKIIGNKIYILINGKQELQNFTISDERRNQLIKALILPDPKMRLDQNKYEVYMKNGNRITIYTNNLVKENQDVIIFRKYIISDYTFEEQLRLGTIPFDAIDVFKNISKIGYNVIFTGAVRTGKTTSLTVYQALEDQSLEGVMIETDPEIPLHKIMPNAPITQLLADGEELKSITKSILRSDADYMILAEARDGIALNIAVKLANKGTRRVKITFHTTNPIDICYDIANEILIEFGGNLETLIHKVAKSFHYIFHYVQLPNKAKKRLQGIYELRYISIENTISIHQICKYDFLKDTWYWNYTIGKDKEQIGEEENIEALDNFKKALKAAEFNNPMDELTYKIR